jgi:hypothetical protein
MSTKSKSLAERMRRIEQKKASIAQDEATLRADERRAPTKRLIEAGALIEKAGFLDFDANILHGALRSLRAGFAHKDQVELWAGDGGRAFAEEARRRDEGKEDLVIVFPGPRCKEVDAAARDAGFRFSKVCRHWEGRARFEDAQSLAAAHGGAARKFHEDRARENPLIAGDADAGAGKVRAANGGGHVPSARPDQSRLFGEDQV